MTETDPRDLVDGLGAVPETVDDSLRQTISDMLAAPKQTGKKGSSFEVLHYRTGMTDPRARICTARPLNIVGAVARFVWMIAGSNRLEDIAFYEPKVRGYTDDHLTVPGSSYGKRLFNATPGLNQMRGVVDRLLDDRQSRQAAAVVWIPQDAVRESNDIPCTFGLFFHVRAGSLIMRTVMRSNNVVRLMPYNFFEFSLLGEVVAATVGVPFGAYLHDAASMHVLDVEVAAAEELLAAPAGSSLRMAPMPSVSDGSSRPALEQAAALAQLEAQMRHAYTRADFAQVRENASAGLDAYWLDMFNVLAAWGAAARGWADTVDGLCAALPGYFQADVRVKSTARLAVEAPTSGTATSSSATEDHETELALDLPDFTAGDRTAALIAEDRRDSNSDAVWVALVEQLKSEPDTFDVAEMKELHDILLSDGAFASARSPIPSEGDTADAYEVTPDDIGRAVRILRSQ